MIGQALQAVTALRTLVEDLRRIRELEDGTLAPHPAAVELRALVAAAVDAAAPAAARRLVTLTVVGEPLEARADPLLLGRALELLVASAVRAAPRRGAVTATIAAAPTAAVIEIADSGAPLDPAQRAALFTRHASAPGRGGLYLAGRIAALHGGAIAADDRAGGGTVVRLTLPRGG